MHLRIYLSEVDITKYMYCFQILDTFLNTW